MFGFGKKDDLKQSRENNIKELKLSFSQIKKLNPNSDINWELLFSTPLQGGQFNTLKITLSPEFPNTRPVMQVVGPLVHVWLDNFKYVTGCVYLNNWTRDSSLRDIVQHVLTGLQTGSGYTTKQPTASSSGSGGLYPIYPSVNQSPGATVISPLPPPTPFERPGTTKISSTQYPPTYTQAQPQGCVGGSGNNSGRAAIHESHQLPNTTTNNNNSFNNNNNKISSQSSSQKRRDISQSAESIERQTSLSMPMPDIPNEFPELREKSEKELQVYLNDPIAFQTLIHSLTSVEGMIDIRNDIRESNAKQAALTLEKGNMTELHHEIIDLQTLLKNQVKTYKESLNRQSYEYCVPASQVKVKLQEKLDILEAKAEEIANRFVTGNCELNVFLKDYTESRQEFYSVGTKLKLINNNNSNNIR